MILPVSLKNQIKKLMTNITDTKPEPIAAIPNWNYDAYYLAQLERLNFHKPRELPKSRKVSIEINKRVIELEIDSKGNE